MAAASLVLGILGLIVFCWAGPAIGTAWTTASSAGSALQGEAVVVIWPIWTLGLIIGVAIPLIGVILGIAGMKKEDSKGICLGGIVLGVIAALIGLGLTYGAARAAMFIENLKDSDQFGQMQQQLQQQLNDPDLQQQIQQQLLQAQQQEPMEPMEPMEPVDPDKPQPDPAKSSPQKPDQADPEPGQPPAQ